MASRAVPLGVWAVMSAALALFVFFHNPNVPYLDQWEITPLVLGKEPLSFERLWEQHHEHRLPLPLAIHVLVLRVSGVNYAAVPWLNLSIMSLSALACVIASAKIRGRACWTDCLFPALLLSWAHLENVLFGWQLQFVLGTGLATVAVITMLGRGNGGIAATSAVAVALPLCGAQGFMLAIALAAWLLGTRGWDSKDGAALCLLMLATWAAGWEMPATTQDRWASWWYVPLNAIEFPGLPFVATFETRTRWSLVLSKVAGLLATAVVLLWLRDVRRSRDRRVGGLVAIAIGHLFLGLAIGSAREQAGLFESQRYWLLAAPLWVAIYFSWVVCPGQHGRAPAWLCVLSLCAAVGAVEFALSGEFQTWKMLHAQRMAFLADLRVGVPLKRLVAIHTHGSPRAYHPAGMRDELIRDLRLLRAAGHAELRKLRGK